MACISESCLRQIVYATQKATAHNLIVRIGKFEAEVTTLCSEKNIHLCFLA